MESADAPDEALAFTEALLRAGYLLCGLAADLAGAIPPEAYPGETRGAVVIEMISGTIRTFLDGVDQREVHRASELMVGACDRVLEHLAARLSGGPAGAAQTFRTIHSARNGSAIR